MEAKQIVSCTRCGSEMKVVYGTRDWICGKCKIFLASALPISVLKGIIDKKDEKKMDNHITIAERAIRIFWKNLSENLNALIDDGDLTVDTTIKEVLDIAKEKIK